MSRPIVFASLLLAATTLGAQAWAQTSAQQLDALADRFVSQALAYDPTLAYEAGLPTTVHDRFADRTPAGLAAFDREEREDLSALRRLDASSLPAASMATYANLREKLESDLQLRVCRAELWNVNHFDGWQSELADVADAQPVGTADERAQALRRWASLPAYIDVEIVNLRRGLAQGYSAPKSVVRRVIKQMDGLVAGAPEASPFFSPAARSNDAAFKAAFRKLITDRIDPALRRYRDFLSTTYLPKAREGVAISDLPNGPACYRAFLRRETTLDRSPEQVFELGRQTVAANTAEVLRLGRQMFGAADIPATLAAAKSAPGQHFGSKDELLAFSRGFLARAKSKTAASLIERLPAQDVVVEPERAFEEAAGVSSHLDPQPDTSKPAVYRIQLGDWASETRAEAEIVVAHETLPGHHLQIALARELSPPTRLSKLISIAAYQEGWARYAEGLAEEAGVYDMPEAAILRRIWPARGMVVDPGLHALHWTREQAIQYLVSTGRYTRKSADDLVDRIAAMPGQLTAYDSGGLEIRALREEARRRLGDRFDLKAFNQAVLEEGVVPLSELHRHVIAWLDAQTRR
jgi:uncharacterized protein (DUF885 family)